MKRLIYLIIAICTFVSCNDESEGFTVDLPAGAFQFTPAMGGAMLRYKLPDDPDVIAINVRYKDVYGNNILKTGSNSTDLLAITGFNEETSDVPAHVSFLKRNNEESQPIDVTFSTLDSAPICFINGAEVKSGWNGCMLEYNNPEGTTGMAHVFYLGINPLDNRQDTILLESFPLNAGQDIRHYTPQQKSAYNTIIVRAEDYRGYIVKEKVWENIQAFNVEKLEPSNFEIVYNNSLEVPEEKIGLQYLTDGDNKGTAWFQTQNAHHYYTFLSKENGVGENSEPMYIDLKKMRPISEVRFYAYRHVGTYSFSAKSFIDWGGSSTSASYQGPQYFKRYLMNKLPCSITIYGCRQDASGSDWNNLKWEILSSFEDDPDIDDDARWTYHAATCGGVKKAHCFGTLSLMEGASTIYKSMSINIDLQKEGFRYLKIKFNGAYNMYPSAYERDDTTNKLTKYLTLHELEIYSDKD